MLNKILRLHQYTLYEQRKDVYLHVFFSIVAIVKKKKKISNRKYLLWVFGCLVDQQKSVLLFALSPVENPSKCTRHRN